MVSTEYSLTSQCLKIIEKVSFNFASEAIYVYNVVDKRSLKMPKMVNFGEFFQKTRLKISIYKRVTKLFFEAKDTVFENHAKCCI